MKRIRKLNQQIPEHNYTNTCTQIQIHAGIHTKKQKRKQIQNKGKNKQEYGTLLSTKKNTKKHIYIYTNIL